MKIILLGAPGSGKGTQANKLKERSGLEHISTGDIFRAAVKDQTELGLKAKGYMDKGELVPDDIVVGMVRERLGQSDCEGGFILDGFPRTRIQAQKLDEVYGQEGCAADYAIYLAVSGNVLIDRLTGRLTCRKCGALYHVSTNPTKQEKVCDICEGEVYIRDDDKEDVVRNRLDVYEKQTAPVVDFYREKGALAEINGEQGIEDIFQEICGQIGI